MSYTIPYRTFVKKIVLIILSFCALYLVTSNEERDTFIIEPHNNYFILIGDTQETGFEEFWRENNWGIRKLLFKKIVDENPDFLIHLGDLVSFGSSASSWNLLWQDFKIIIENNIYAFPVLGNHDYYGSNLFALDKFYSVFPHLREFTWYTIRYDSLILLLLNSNFDEISEQEILNQKLWYSERLSELDQDSSVSAIIIICHHPPFTNSTVVSDNEEVQEQFVKPFLDSDKTRIFFSGHAHTFEYFKSDNKHFFVSGGGGGPRQSTDTSTQHKYADLVQSSVEVSGKFHYCKMNLSEFNFTLDLVCLDEQDKDWQTSKSFNINLFPVK
ncbi:metallophosphoesterase family protein [Bacteroidota bacterium]